MRSPAQFGRCYASYFVAAWLLFAGRLVFVAADGATQCASGQLDWYTSVVGETPCKTYERLRQICNSDYQVPKFKSKPPGDACDDQVSACCCNDVAFGLSMLCMNCQLDPKAGNEIGIDAPPGTYATYRGACGAGTDKALDAETQRAVCNKNIKIDDFLYNGWDDGAWFYVWTKEHAEVTHAASNNNTFTHCSNQVSSSASLAPLGPSSSTSTSPTPSQASSPSIASSSQVSPVPTPSGNTTNSAASGDHTSSGLSFAASAAIGGVVGVLGVCAIAAAGIFFWRRHKRAQHAYTCPSNAARRSYNVFADKPPETAGVASPYLMSTDTRGQMDGDLKPNRFV
ncbi:hypothetical protein VTO73DRAFT_5368 [Trametes versicolor]